MPESACSIAKLVNIASRVSRILEAPWPALSESGGCVASRVDRSAISSPVQNLNITSETKAAVPTWLYYPYPRAAARPYVERLPPARAA